MEEDKTHERYIYMIMKYCKKWILYRFIIKYETDQCTNKKFITK